jgi:hypothetical protein
MPEEEPAAVRRDVGPLTSTVQERRQEEAAAKRHQSAVGEQPHPYVREEARPVTPHTTNLKIGSPDLVGLDGRQSEMAETSQAETPHTDSRHLGETAAQPGLEARCELVRPLKTGTRNLSRTAKQ